MRFSDALDYSLVHMRKRQLRSWLTIIGIILGIATIVVLVAVGEGVKADINKQLEAFGPDMIAVIPFNIDSASSGSFSSAGFTTAHLYERDESYIRKVAGVEDVAKAVYGRASIQFRDKEITSPVYASTTNMFEMFPQQYEVEEGRQIQPGEKNVVFLGYNAANKLFGKDKISVGNYIYINGVQHRVVGIEKLIGTSFSSSDDASIYIPYDEKKTVLANSVAEDEVFMFTIKVVKGADTEAVAEQITDQLASSHRVSVDKKDFSVITAASVQSTVNQITSILTGSLFLIGLISAVVGGIGIANTMFMSVLERTKEIGILKAIGATSFQILSIFLIEAGLIGATGGIIGLGVGIVVIALVPYFGITPYLSPEVAVGAVLFAIGVGAVAGLIPARNASKIPAVEALSYD